MSEALIGYSGFVGSNLLSQQRFEEQYNSANIRDIRGKRFDRIVCAGARAVKWWANQNPEADLAGIESLMDDLRYVEADQFTLISTVDVFGTPVAVTELSSPSEDGLHAYGRHRLLLEKFVAERFPSCRILRLPALFGSGLKKNAVFDLMTDNNLDSIHPDSCFQWYPLSRLSADMRIAEEAGLETLHLATQPISMEDIRSRFFPEKQIGQKRGQPGMYDFRTVHSGLFGSRVAYMLSAPEIMAELAKFLNGDQS